jgi:hypothetical protein
MLAMAGCAPSVPLTIGCPDAKPKTVKISFKKNEEIRVNRPVLNVEQGDVIVCEIKGGAGIEVIIEGAESDDEWLDTKGKGSPDGNSYYVCVEDDQDVKDYKYNIEVVGVGTLDPVVRVKTKGSGA